jgi:archaellum biogenesis protein FlaJ (TadC family)
MHVRIRLKAQIHSTFTGTVTGVTSAMVGLGNVTIQVMQTNQFLTATQTALDLKAIKPATGTAKSN